MSLPTTSPIRLAIVNDFEVVVAGVTSMLAPYRDRVEIVELDPTALRTGSVDLVLYDTFGLLHRDRSHLIDLVARSRAKVVVFSWSLRRADIDLAYVAGAAGYLSKSLPAAEIVAALESVHAGRTVEQGPIAPDATPGTGRESGDWPGRGSGLSLRESEVLVYITQGLSNQEIAQVCYLGINTVKTYILSLIHI